MEHIPDNQSGISYCFQLHLAVSLTMCFSVTTITAGSSTARKIHSKPNECNLQSLLSQCTASVSLSKNDKFYYPSRKALFALIGWPMQFLWLVFAKKLLFAGEGDSAENFSS